MVSCSKSSATSGFTLIELLVVVAIIAIVAMIAMPLYTDFVKRSYESQACQTLLRTSDALSAWQSKTLSFRNFEPDGGFADGSKTIYTPADGTSSDYKYQITVIDAVGGMTKTLDDPAASGRYWRMKAKPASTGLVRNANQYYIDSTGKRCMFISSATINLSNTNVCGDTNAEEWNCG